MLELRFIEVIFCPWIKVGLGRCCQDLSMYSHEVSTKAFTAAAAPTKKVEVTFLGDRHLKVVCGILYLSHMLWRVEVAL